MPLVGEPASIEGFDTPFEVTYSDMVHWVYSRGQGPAVVIFHELPGLTKKCRDLAMKVADAGFTVFVPLLFGKPLKSASAANMMRMCVSREFYLFSDRQSSPITDWMRHLCHQALDRCKGPGVGVIGMCLTGNFALSLMAEKEVLAPVVCQPSLPVNRKSGLAISPADLESAKGRAKALGDKSVIGFRYEKDGICPPDRFERIAEEFGRAWDGETIPGKGHSVLTEHLHEPALQKTIAFLKSKLLPDP